MKRFTEYITEYNISIFDSPEIPDRNILFDRINTLKDWLYMSSGLGMMKIIDEIFEEQSYESPLTNEEISKFYSGLEVLRKTSMDNSYIDSRLSKFGGIESKSIVRNEIGEWDYVNKLNTNMSDLADLLTELIMRGIQKNFEKGKSIYDSVVKDPKTGLESIKPYLKKLIIFYFVTNGDGLEDFRKFTKFSKQFTDIGERAEEEVMKLLVSKDFQIVYSGGNGDFIDMIFGTDMIVFRDDIAYKTVQVKTKIRDWSKLQYYKVDWVAETRPIKIYNLRDRTEVLL